MAMSVLAKVRAMKARGPILILRWVQLSIAVLILILAIYVANWYNMETRSMSAPGEINLMIFVPCWSIFSFVWIMVANAYIPMLQNPYIRLAVDTSNLLLNFVSFVALAAFLGGLEYCRGSVCGAARGAVAFASFEWVLWTATAFLVARECFFNKNGGGWRRGGGGSARAAVVGPAGAAETKEMQTA